MNSNRFHIVRRSQVEKGVPKIEIEVLCVDFRELYLLKKLRDNEYLRHEHCSGNPVFRHVEKTNHELSSRFIPHPAISSQCIITLSNKLYIYSLFGKLGEPILFCRLPLFHDDDYEQITSPICQTRFFSWCVSLSNKVYLWAGLLVHKNVTSDHFGEFFDPKTNIWTPIHRPPVSDPLIGTKSHLFIASLGASSQKFLIYDYAYSQKIVYIYDAVYREWTVHNTNPPPNFEPKYVYMGSVISGAGDFLYWIDKRRGFIYGLNWKNMHVYSGPIVGSEHMPVLDNLKYLSSGICLHHLWDSYFCLSWSIAGEYCTEDHYTLLRLELDNTSSGSLKVFVQGCFVDSRPPTPRFLDTMCLIPGPK